MGLGTYSRDVEHARAGWQLHTTPCSKVLVICHAAEDLITARCMCLLFRPDTRISLLLISIQKLNSQRPTVMKTSLSFALDQDLAEESGFNGLSG